MKKIYFIFICKLKKLFLYILDSNVSLYFQIGLELLFFLLLLLFINLSLLKLLLCLFILFYYYYYFFIYMNHFLENNLLFDERKYS